MLVFESVKTLQDYLQENTTKSIGFVPTMGALHIGHLSLIEASQKKCDITICSIFVNPTQFNKKEDLIKYPRNTAKDLQMLESTNCDVVFIPSVDEMYGEYEQKEFDFGALGDVMEGEHRPGHFNGVANVIQRFFEIMNPTCAFFGEKDFQQLAVVKELAKQIKSPTEVIGCPIFREDTGLAMSSRNERLSVNEKDVASEISKALQFVCEHKKSHTVTELKSYFSKQMSQHSIFDPEYFEIANAETLEPVNNWKEAENFIAFTAVNLNGVRLIDNMTIIN